MSTSDTILYLSRKDIENLCIPIKNVISTVEQAFLQKAHGNIEAPPKPGIHPTQDAFIHAMPAYLRETRAAGMKWVSGFPENPAHGLPYIAGLLILNDASTGFPICIMDCTWLTAKRTGAATAVAAKYLARRNSSTLGILGCGVQGRSNLEALTVMFDGIAEVKAYDIIPANQKRYVKEMSQKYCFHVVPVGSPKEAVENCDIVVSAGPILKHPEPVVEPSWVSKGTFICPLDFDSYWKPETMRSMAKFCTDDLEQLMYYRKQGYFANIPLVYAELSEIVSGKKKGRESDYEKIMSMNLGLAIEDIATAKTIFDKARKAETGTLLPL
jgi:ornithine cyclodeaminase/alanine dehydrogenase-like protein (mu-crystallin family)